MKVKAIKRGIVIDHITAGKGLEIFSKLNLERVRFPVVLLMNVESPRFGRTDVIKVENRIDLDMDMLALMDDQLTVNIIEDNVVSGKRKPSLPKVVKGLFECFNPRCISNEDPYVDASFVLLDAGKKIYKCEYCEENVPLTDKRFKL